MTNAGKIAVGIGGIIVVGAVAASLSGVFNNGGDDGGIDISNTSCDGIGEARAAVQAELEERQTNVENQYAEDREKASDDYWAERRRLEDAKNACITDALLADPCKDLFEESSRLAQEILDNIDSGFDEAKAQRREDVKKEYDDCLENPPHEKTYEGKREKCEADFTAGEAAAQTAREQAEAAAVTKRDQAITNAQNAHQTKMATLAEIERRCNVPPPTTNVNAGGVTTGGTGTIIQSGNPACTGRFSGYDPETQAEIFRLTQLYNQAMAGGKYEGLGGANSLSAKINELRTEMLAGPRKCTNDAFCGDPEPVCCSETEVGQVKCADGVCVAEKTPCEEDEICTGEPAECVAPSTGVQSAAVEIRRTISIGQVCSNNLQNLNLQPASEESDRFEITGNIPSWLGFSHVGGKLPQDVLVTAQCATLQGQGPGTYTASGHITIYNANNELINTIPLNVVITVVGTVVEEDDGGTGVTGGGGTVTDPPEEEEEPVTVVPQQVSFTYDHANPVCPLSAGTITINGPEGSTWSIASNLPIWLQSASGSSGTVPATISLQFPCALERYENQTQSTNLQFSIQTPSGAQSASVQVNGNFTNF